MNKENLKKFLNEKGIDSDLYNLDGKGRVDERFCLENKNDEWYVYYSERGIKTTNKRFLSEEDACDYIYNQLV